MKILIPSQVVNLKEGERVPFPFGRIVQGEDVTCKITCNHTNPPAVITAEAILWVKKPDRKKNLTIHKVLNENHKTFNLLPEEVLDQEDYRFEEVILNSDRDVMISFEITHEPGSGFIE